MEDISVFKKILTILNNIVETRKILHANKLYDCNKILEVFGYTESNNCSDSGYYTETINNNDKCLIPTTVLIEIFDSDNLETIFEECVKFIFFHIQNRNYELTLSTDYEILIEIFTKSLKFLEETDSDVQFSDVVSKFLTSELNNTLQNDNEMQFNFVMELFRRCSSIKSLQEPIMEILFSRIKTFTKNLNPANAILGFCFERDFNRLNIFLMFLLVMTKKYNCLSLLQSNSELCDMIENLTKFDEFSVIQFLSYKVLNKNDIFT